MVVANDLGTVELSVSAPKKEHKKFDLEQEIAKAEAEFERLEKALSAITATKNKKSASYDPDKLRRKNLAQSELDAALRSVKNLRLCQSFLPGTIVEADLGKNEISKGVVEKIFIDNRNVPMLLCKFGEEFHEISPRNLKAPGIDFSDYPGGGNELEARKVRNQILGIKCQQDHLDLCGKFSSEKLNWVRLNMISLEDRNRIRSLIENNPVPRPVKVGDYVGDRHNGQLGIVSSVTLNGLTIGDHSEIITWTEFEENQYQRLKTEDELIPVESPELVGKMFYCDLHTSNVVVDSVHKTRIEGELTTVARVRLVPARDEFDKVYLSPLTELQALEGVSGKSGDIYQIEAESASGKLEDSVQIEFDRDEQYTPNTSDQPVLDLVAKALGGQIDVDLMANAAKTVPARFHITKVQNYFTFDLSTLGEGLKGFMNPPFSDPLTPLKKLCGDFAAGHISEAIVLFKAGVAHNQGTGKLIEQYASVQCQWGVHVGRIGFIKQGVQRKGADFDCSLYYFGDNPDKFKTVFKDWGLMSNLIPSEKLSGKKEDSVQIASLNIKEVCRDSVTQQRCKLDLVHVAKLKTLLENGVEVEPLQVMFDDKIHWLWDGYHRLQAYQELGYEDVICSVTLGTRRDAVLKSVTANVDHPTVLPLTLEDKRRSAQTLLTDPEWKHWSNREIGRLCGLTHITVGAIRQSLSGKKEDSNQIAPTSNTITCVRNGKEMQMNRRPPAPPKPLAHLPYEVDEPVKLIYTKNFEGNQVDRGLDGIWGIITHVGVASCQVYLYLHKKEIQCFPQQMTKLDKDKQVQIKSIGDRIKILLEDFDIAQHSGASGLLEGLLRTDTFSAVDLMLLESLEKVKDVGDRAN